MRRQPRPRLAPARRYLPVLSIDSLGVLARPSGRRLVRLLQNCPLAIVESSDDAIIVNTLDGLIVGWNRAAERIYGYSAREIVGEPFSVLCPSELKNRLPPIMEKIKKGKRVAPYETVCTRKDGSRIDVSVAVSPILNARGDVLGASVIARDVSDQKRSEESIRYLATHDPLTGLANYTSLLNAFDSELRRSDRTGRPFAVLLLDVDRLKGINDTHGHLVGGQVLCRLAAALKRACRSIDTAARYGGDEFAVLAVETDQEIALRIGERITGILAQDDGCPSFTVSQGAAVYPQDGYTVENLLAVADRALYKNKLRAALRSKSYGNEFMPKAPSQAETGAERRRSKRFFLDVPLLVHGESLEQKPFQETTFTISVSAHGTLLVLATNVALGQTLFLQNPQTQCGTEGRVVRFALPYGGLAQVGIEFAQPFPQLWPVEQFPDGCNLQHG